MVIGQYSSNNEPLPFTIIDKNFMINCIHMKESGRKSINYSNRND